MTFVPFDLKATDTMSYLSDNNMKGASGSLGTAGMPSGRAFAGDTHEGILDLLKPAFSGVLQQAGRHQEDHH